MKDVLFCVEARWRQECDFVLVKDMKVHHIYREEGVGFWGGLRETFKTFRKYGRWERAVEARLAEYSSMLYGSVEVRFEVPSD
ncbi:hypothetical protein RQP46_001522 [Phenoliferia psychrophenolica]